MMTSISNQSANEYDITKVLDVAKTVLDTFTEPEILELIQIILSPCTPSWKQKELDFIYKEGD